MEIELLYLAELESNGLSVRDLPEDAQTGIQEINNVLKAIHMTEKGGKKVNPNTLKKVKAMDKWVYYEILDYINDTDKNADEIPFDAEEVIDDLDKSKGGQAPKEEVIEADPLGIKIDAELDILFATGKTTYTMIEIRTAARNTYKVLWDEYEEGGENGIVTSKYSFLEDPEKNFNLKLK